MHFDARPITPGHDQEAHQVSDLMTEAGQWNEEVIRATFPPIDANAIVRIPVCLQEDDSWAWVLEKHSDYSVRSAYRKLAAPQTYQASASGDESWKQIWKLTIPPKVKVFWCEFCMNSYQPKTSSIDGILSQRVSVQFVERIGNPSNTFLLSLQRRVVLAGDESTVRS